MSRREKVRKACVCVWAYDGEKVEEQPRIICMRGGRRVVGVVGPPTERDNENGGEDCPSE